MLLGSTEPITTSCNFEEMLKKLVSRVVSTEIILSSIISSFKQQNDPNEVFNLRGNRWMESTVRRASWISFFTKYH